MDMKQIMKIKGIARKLGYGICLCCCWRTSPAIPFMRRCPNAGCMSTSGMTTTWSLPTSSLAG